MLFSQKACWRLHFYQKSMMPGSLPENTITLSEITSSFSKSLIVMREKLRKLLLFISNIYKTLAGSAKTTRSERCGIRKVWWPYSQRYDNWVLFSQKNDDCGLCMQKVRWRSAMVSNKYDNWETFSQITITECSFFKKHDDECPSLIKYDAGGRWLKIRWRWARLRQF